MLNPYDQQVYDAGFKYIPQSQYLLNPFQIPVAPEASGETVTGGLPAIYQAQSGGGGGMMGGNIRTDYSPYAARQYFAQPGSEVGIPSGMLADSKFMYGNQIQLPGILGMGQQFLKNIMPINERAILENEARGAGIFTDDIGRVVQGPGSINTGANIMAGYNLNQITPETIEKRRAMIEKNMKDPAQKKAKLDALKEFEDMYFGPFGAKTISTGIYKQRKDKKVQAEIDEYNRKAAEEARIAQEAAQRAEMERIKQQDEARYRNQPGEYGGPDRQTEREQAGPGYTGTGSAEEMGSFMDGGIVDLVDIYD
jgi:hypothetical protein